MPRPPLFAIAIMPLSVQITAEIIETVDHAFNGLLAAGFQPDKHGIHGGPGSVVDFISLNRVRWHIAGDVFIAVIKGGQ